MIHEHLTKHELQRFLSLKTIVTDAGRGRAWLRSTLNEHSLERYLHMVLGSTETLRYAVQYLFHFPCFITPPNHTPSQRRHLVCYLKISKTYFFLLKKMIDIHSAVISGVLENFSLKISHC